MEERRKTIFFFLGSFYFWSGRGGERGADNLDFSVPFLSSSACIVRRQLPHACGCWVRSHAQQRSQPSRSTKKHVRLQHPTHQANIFSVYSRARTKKNKSECPPFANLGTGFGLFHDPK